MLDIQGSSIVVPHGVFGVVVVSDRAREMRKP